LAANGFAQLVTVSGDAAFVRPTPQIVTYEETYTTDAVAVVVRGEISDPETLRAIDRFDRRASAIDSVETVVSPADAVRRHYGTIPNSAADIERVIGNPGFVVLSVVLEPGLTDDDVSPIYEQTLTAADWATFPVGTALIVTGDPAYNVQLATVIGQSTQQLLGLSVGLMIVALYFLFRGVRLRLLPIVAVMVGVVYTLGVLGYTGIPNSTLTSAVFPILIGLGIDYSVQFHPRYEEELASSPPREALPRALGAIGPPVLVALGAAGLGFAATGATSRAVPSLVWFAETSIIGISLTFLTGIIVLLSILTIYVTWRSPEGRLESHRAPEGTDVTEPVGQGAFERIVGPGTRWLASRPAEVFLVAGLLMVAGFVAGGQVDLMTDTDSFVPPDLPALVDLNTLQSL
ncbi:MAG: MMPL family transporter, partial [Halobacteriales archaeon]|nr:MMPL family transporter [Halobacteriales archaeon]